MKIRNHRKREWWFYPPEDSKLNKGSCYRFKYKRSLMNFIAKNIEDAINGSVRLEESCFGGSYCIREWFVWYNDKQYRDGAAFRVDLRQLDFRGRKFVTKSRKVSKEDKKYFAFSDKVISLMCHLKKDDGTILAKDAQRLVELFKKRGFKDFDPTEEDLEYINGHISNGIDFFHWSDRCSFLRAKTVIEYFKRNNLINEKTI